MFNGFLGFRPEHYKTREEALEAAAEIAIDNFIRRAKLCGADLDDDDHEAWTALEKALAWKEKA